MELSKETSEIMRICLESGHSVSREQLNELEFHFRVRDILQKNQKYVCCYYHNDIGTTVWEYTSDKNSRKAFCFKKAEYEVFNCRVDLPVAYVNEQIIPECMRTELDNKINLLKTQVENSLHFSYTQSMRNEQ